MEEEPGTLISNVELPVLDLSNTDELPEGAVILDPSQLIVMLEGKST